jgi:hypothetical protein
MDLRGLMFTMLRTNKTFYFILFYYYYYFNSKRHEMVTRVAILSEYDHSNTYLLEAAHEGPKQ